VAENRAARPNEFDEAWARETLSRRAAEEAQAACPFCHGHEHRTPPAVYESLDAQGRWQVRAVPNRYPAVTLSEEIASASTSRTTIPSAWPLSTRDSSSAVPAIGVHEVIVESPRHVDRMSALGEVELRSVLESYAARLRYWRADGRFSYALVFKNQGPRAGASLAHVHSQLIVLPNVPPLVQAEMERAEREFSERQACPYCLLIEQERSTLERTVHESDSFVVFCPFASLQAYEVWLMPTKHSTSFEDLPSATFEDLSRVLHDVIRRVESVVPDAAYNLLLRTRPWRGCDAAWSHWRIELVPRTTALAGLELGAGVYINPVAPERAAGKLRSI
jgi:UDPglucose--hexose-1-phosphate uridylyltransferase